MKYAYVAPSDEADHLPPEVQQILRHTDPRAHSLVFDDYDDITLSPSLPCLPFGARSLWMESPVDDELSTWAPASCGWYMSDFKNVRFSENLVVGTWEDDVELGTLPW
ncbi:hypothetical protein [Luteococcus sp. OSA5]|uniref:hypothetical protein n=1 Tax=Luteococcus sp. OSA5 TaxID=3401630 RepID=UPI003B4381D4